MEKSLGASFLFLFLSLLLHQSNGFPFPSLIIDNEVDSFKWRRQDEDMSADPNIALLEKEGAALNQDFFKEDVVLAQGLDRINEISKYSDPMDNSTVFFERQVMDGNKAVVALTAAEDKRQTKVKDKRTYTVLIKAPAVADTKTAFYYMLFAYIRDARSTDNPMEVHTVGGKKVTIEWDGWDDREPNPKFHNGWPTCVYTIMFSCSVNETAIESAIDKKTIQSIVQPVNATAAAETKAVASSNGPSETQDKIKSEGKDDPDTYADLYGDFDVRVNDGKSGRGLLGSLGGGLCQGLSFLGNGGSDCVSSHSTVTTTTTTMTVKKKKIVKVVASPSIVSWVPGLNSKGTKPASSNADAVYGTYYQGLKSTPAIFLPDEGPLVLMMFLPDKESLKPEHGVFVPGAAGYPDHFEPEAANPNMPFNTPGTMIPDEMTAASRTGGIHGNLSGESFRPDALGHPMWFNPDGPEAKGVWTTYKKDASAPARPKKTANGEDIIYGIEFKGDNSIPDIFVPDGQGIPGYFLPNDPAHPEVVSMPHGSFVAAKPAGHGTFYPDNLKELATVQQVRGAFMPDGMNLTGVIAGLITKNQGTGCYVFVCDVPGEDFEYFKSKPGIKGMWAPFLKPGEWSFTPPTIKTTPKPVLAPAPPANAGAALAAAEGVATTTPTPEAAATPSPPPPPAVDSTGKKTNQNLMFGIKFESMGTMEIFLPDDYPVPGWMYPEDVDKYKPIQGVATGLVKKPEKVKFKPSDASVIATHVKMNAMFVPDNIPKGNGIMGSLEVDAADKTVLPYTPDPAGAGYWFIKGKPENSQVWTPFTPPPPPPTTKKPTMLEKMKAQPFVQGTYVPGTAGSPDVFVPESGAIGCFYPDKATAKSCGTFYPASKGVGSEFVQDTAGTLKANTVGMFIPELSSGKTALERFKATFAEGPPATLSTDEKPYSGWAQTEVKAQTTMKRTVAPPPVAAEEDEEGMKKHPSHIALPVGGGFNGYPTNGKGIDALLEPNNPVFKEFLQWKSRQDKTIKADDKIVIIPTPPAAEGAPAPAPPPATPGTAYINLEDYKKYVDDRYTIKNTRIKTDDMDERVEIAVPKAADKYIKKKRAPKPLNLKLNINAMANAMAGAGGGNGSTGSAQGGASGSGWGGVKGTKGGKDCDAPWSTGAKAIAKADNGSSANAEANAVNGGDANAMSLGNNGSTANAKASVKDGGKANALSKTDAKGAKANALAEAEKGANANAIAKKTKEGSQGGNATAKATRTDDPKKSTECDGGLPDEIEIDSHAASTILQGNGTGGTTINSVANTNVKIDIAALAAKLMELQQKQAEGSGDDDYEPGPIVLDINANAQASSAAGRSFEFVDQDSQKGRVVAALGKGTVLKQGTFFRSGWKTELKMIKANVTFEHEGIVFYGLGSCPYTPGDLSRDKTPEVVIDFYIKMLRMDCTEKVKLRVMKLFNLGYLKFDKNMDYFLVPPDNEIAKKAKITDTELRQLSAAFEFYIFSLTYHEQLLAAGRKDVAPYVAAEVGIPATRSIRFITEFALNYVELCRQHTPLHYVRMTRHLLTTLRTVMIKLYQDGLQVAKCKECTNDQKTNHDDQIHLMGVLEYVIHGIGPFEHGEAKDMRKALKGFLILNRKALENRVKDYDKHYPNAKP